MDTSGQQQLNIEAIAQGLLQDLEKAGVHLEGRKEGVVMLFEAIRAGLMEMHRLDVEKQFQAAMEQMPAADTAAAGVPSDTPAE